MATAATGPAPRPDGGALDVSIDGTVYRVQVPAGEVGERLATIMRAADQLVLGETLKVLIANRVSWVKIQRLSRYALAYFLLGPDVAELLRVSGALAGTVDRAAVAQYAQQGR